MEKSNCKSCNVLVFTNKNSKQDYCQKCKNKSNNLRPKQSLKSRKEQNKKIREKKAQKRQINNIYLKKIKEQQKNKICAIKTCNNLNWFGSDYCIECKCSNYLCVNQKRNNIKYCLECECAKVNCTKMKIHDYCLSHTCFSNDCYNMVDDNVKYCVKCENKNTNDNQLNQKCKDCYAYTSCDQFYCIDHKCILKNCKKSRYNNKFCLEHKMHNMGCDECGNLCVHNNRISLCNDKKLKKSKLCDKCITSNKLKFNVCLLDNCLNLRLFSNQYCKYHFMCKSIKTFLMINKTKDIYKIPKCVMSIILSYLF